MPEKRNPMSYQEKATTLHESGSNCCQAVLGAYCDHWNMDEDTAYRLGAFLAAACAGARSAAQSPVR